MMEVVGQFSMIEGSANRLDTEQEREQEQEQEGEQEQKGQDWEVEEEAWGLRWKMVVRIICSHLLIAPKPPSDQRVLNYLVNPRSCGLMRSLRMTALKRIIFDIFR